MWAEAGWSVALASRGVEPVGGRAEERCEETRSNSDRLHSTSRRSSIAVTRSSGGSSAARCVSARAGRARSASLERLRRAAAVQMVRSTSTLSVVRAGASCATGSERCEEAAADEEEADALVAAVRALCAGVALLGMCTDRARSARSRSSAAFNSLKRLGRSAGAVARERSAMSAPRLRQFVVHVVADRSLACSSVAVSAVSASPAEVSSVRPVVKAAVSSERILGS